MRRRVIDPEFWLDEELAVLSAHAKLLYIGLWQLCDDNFATFPNRPEWIRAQIFPYETVDTAGLLEELENLGKIVRFTDDGKEYFWIKNFFDYQKIDKPSKPKYPKYESSRRVVGESSESTRAEDKLSKEKLSEDNNISGDKRPEFSLNGRYSLDSILADSSKRKVGTEWQFQALDMAERLGIKLAEADKGRWFRVFKQANGGRKAKNLQTAFDYVIDHPRLVSTEEKMNMFFYVYENGLTKGGT